VDWHNVIAGILENLGVGRDAAHVYTLMLTNSEAGMQELVAATGMEEAALRATLDELADLTFVRASLDEPGAIRVIRPEVALDILIRRQESEFARRAHELAASKAAVAQMLAAINEGESDAYTDEIVKLTNINEIIAKLEVLTTTVEHEVLSVMPGGAQSQESLNASRPLDSEALSRGVALPTLYQDSIRNDLPTYAYAHWLSSQGAEVRTAPMVPPRMVIFDRRVAVLPVNPSNTRAGAICTREQGVVATLIHVWTQAWETALPLGAFLSADAEKELTPSERALLLLQASGMTDEAVAKRLGIGLRTVRRKMARLMERLGASSRFEAGLKASQHGWLLMPRSLLAGPVQRGRR
jgi:DNA-binding CsgD family transcriptional regulator/sugar-specific transcriptional regulator TrmB